MRLFTNPAPASTGVGKLMPGQFVVPQNPLQSPTYKPRMGEILSANFTVPQNPIAAAMATSTIGRTMTGPGAAWREKTGQVKGMGCGGSCGCGGTCDKSHDMEAFGPGLVNLSGVTAMSGLGGTVLGVDTGQLSDSFSGIWDQVSAIQVAGIPIVYLVGGFMAYQFLFAREATGHRPSRVTRAKKRLTELAA